MMGKAQKQYLNKVAKRSAELLERKARERYVMSMEDDKSYHDKRFNISLTGREWKELVKGAKE